MTFVYTQSQLLSDINAEIHGKIGMISSQTDFVNSVVREVHNDVTIRSTRRRADLAPNLFPEIYQYACPSDLRDYKIIDIPAQAKRYDGHFKLVPTEQFSVRPDLGDIAIDDYNGVRTLLINSEVPAKSQLIAELDSTTSGGGTWEAFGDAENVARDGDDFIKGSGSISFDISNAGGTTAGLQNAALNTFDITDFLGGDSAVFVWVKINSTTGITNFILRLGNDASTYYSKTITARSDGNAFESGWNLLRFDLTSLSETGSVADTAIDYAALYMTKTAGKISETDYKFDWLTTLSGKRHYVQYISRFPWTTSAGVWIEKSTSAQDLLAADTSEYELFVKRGKYKGLQFTNADQNDKDEAKQDYLNAVASYASQNPDESKVMISTYHYQ